MVSGGGALAPSQAMTGRLEIEGVAAGAQEGGCLASTSWRAFYDDSAIPYSPPADSLYRKAHPCLPSPAIWCRPMSRRLHPAGTRTGRRSKLVLCFFSPKTAGTEDDDAVDSDVDIAPCQSHWLVGSSSSTETSTGTTGRSRHPDASSFQDQRLGAAVPNGVTA